MPYYLAEVEGFGCNPRTACSNGVARETWTLRAKSLKSAKALMANACGTEVLCIARVPDVPRRHWRAG
jgi:hypothetical protein